MSDHEAYAARILTFAPDGRVVDAARGTFEPQTMRVATGQADARPFADLADVPVSRVYLGVQPGAATDGTSTSLVAAGATDRSFIVIERENGYKQVIETNPAAAQQLDVGTSATAADIAAPDRAPAQPGAAPAIDPAPGKAGVPAPADAPAQAGVPNVDRNVAAGTAPAVDVAPAQAGAQAIAPAQAGAPGIAPAQAGAPGIAPARTEAVDVSATAGSSVAVPSGVAAAPAPAAADVVPDVERGAPSGVAAETHLGAYLSPDAVTVDLTAPAYADVPADRHLTRYANELIANSQTGSSLATEARGKTDTLAPEASRSAASVDARTSSLVMETAGAAGAADLQRANQQLEARQAEKTATQRASAAAQPGTQTSFDLGVQHGAGAPSPAAAAAAEASPQTKAQTQTGGGAGGPNDPGTKTPDGDPKRQEKPELTPVERQQSGIGPENRGRELVGERPAFDRAADARLDGLQVKYNQFDVQETLESSRASHMHQTADQQLQYTRDGAPATARPGYQQDGRIVGMTSESVTQDIGQYKVAVYSTKGLMDMASDPAQLQSTLSRAAEQGSSVGLNFSRSGGLSVADLSQGRTQDRDQDRGMGRSLF